MKIDRDWLVAEAKKNGINVVFKTRTFGDYDGGKIAFYEPVFFIPGFKYEDCWNWHKSDHDNYPDDWIEEVKNIAERLRGYRDSLPIKRKIDRGGVVKITKRQVKLLGLPYLETHVHRYTEEESPKGETIPGVNYRLAA